MGLLSPIPSLEPPPCPTFAKLVVNHNRQRTPAPNPPIGLTAAALQSVFAVYHLAPILHFVPGGDRIVG
jgi:hypothetical protein